MKSLDLKNPISKIVPLLRTVRQYLSLILIVTFVGAYSFLVYRINMLARSEPAEDAVAEKLQSVKQPKIDQSAVEKINQLQDQNIEVKALFDQARQNPFTE